MRRLAFVGSLIIVMTLSNPVDVAHAEGCSAADARAGICSNVSRDGGSVELGGSDTPPDVPGSGGGGRPVAPGASVPSTDGSGLGGNPREIVDALDPCPVPGDCTPIVDGEFAVTLSDLASFAPTAPSIAMEPNGWMLRGLPANFIADAPGSATDGVLLGRPVSVRFAPVAYTWTWGDGTTDTVTEPGRTWERLGVPRFSETATSHIYRDRGTVTVSLSVAFSASYSFDGGGWRSVDGTVTATTSLDAHVGTAHTVLVPSDCAQSPHADGC